MPLTPWQATVNPHIHRRLLDTHRQVWISLLWGYCSFLLGPGAHKVLFVPSKMSVSRYWGSSVIKFHWPSKSNSLGVLSPSARSPGSEICVGPRSFATVWELLWYNCSPICGSSAWELCDGANANFLQEDLCHMPHLPGLLQPDPLSLRQVTTDLCLCRKHSTLKGKSGSVSYGVPGSWCAQGFVCALGESLVGIGLILDVSSPFLTSCRGFSSALGCGVSFFGRIQHSAVSGCSAANCKFWNSHRKRWVHVLLFHHPDKNHKDSWELKSWCFWTVVLEKTLESFLDC